MYKFLSRVETLCKKVKIMITRIFFKSLPYSCESKALYGKTRAVVDGLCSTNRSLFTKEKPVGKWLIMGEESGGETCVWSHQPNFICQCYHGLLFRNVTTRMSQHLCLCLSLSSIPLYL